jgi:PAS domain S-box-containing protein
LLEANQTALDFGGITRDQVIGKPVWETHWFSYSGDLQKRVQQSVKEAALGEFIRHEIDVLGAGGSIATIDFSIRPIKDESGQVLLLIPEGRDISHLKAIEQDLRKNEAMLLESQQIAKLGNWQWNVADDKIIWSPELFKVFGVDPSLGTPGYEEHLLNFVEEDRKKLDLAVQQAVNNGDSYHLELQIKHSDQSYRYVAAIGHAEYDNNGQVSRLYGTVQDISDRKFIEKNLRKSQARLVEAQRITKLGNWEWDVASDTTIWSQELYRIFGRDPALCSPSYEEVLLLYVEEDRQKHAQAVQLCVSTGESYYQELRILKPDGSCGYIEAIGHAECDEYGKVIRLYGTAQDISDRKNIEQELNHNKTLLRLTLENAPIGIARLAPDGKFLSVNHAFCEIYGYSAEELLSMTAIDITHPDSIERTLATLQGLIDNKTHKSQIEKQYIHKNGNIIDAISRVSLMRDEISNSIQFITIVEDITDRKKIEANLEAAKLAEAANQAKSEFLAVMSHELRSPMNAVISMTEILRNTSLSLEQQQYVDTIHQGGEILLSVVNNVLDFSRIESGHFELEQRPFNLHQCVDQLLELMTTCIAAKSLELSVLINPDVPKEIMGDHICLRQILINLVSNAIKFTERGEIVITVTSQLSIPETNSYKLVFSVRDTGIGIAPKDLHNLFKSFGQANSSIARQYGGTGLGLVICKQLCELMGGAISVNSTLGEGSTFSFSIMASAIANPIKESAPDHEGIAEHIVENLSVLSERELNLEGKRILLVCSNPNIGQAIVMYTKAWHICTQIAESGSEAMLLFESANFDAVLIDENLGEMDALELANDIHQIFSDLKLVLLAFVKTLPEANGFENAKSRSSKFVACINKPITSSKLYQTLINIFYPEQAQPIRDGVDSANISVSNPSNLQGDMGKDLPLSILIVEDNPINQQLLSKMLKKLSYQAEVVDNGQKAVEAVTQKMYDIIFMDLQMPIMDGLTATKHIRQMPQRQPWIIGISANSFSESQKSALAVGMNEYLTKPLHSEGLIAAIKRISKSVPQGVLQIVPEISIETSVSKPNNSSIDLTIFTSIENSVGKENLLEIIDNYFNQAEQEIANMRAAFNKQDIVTLEANNHSLKGGSGLFGATKLLKLCRSLQFMCRICLETNEYAIDDINQIGLVLQNIGAEYDLVKQALKSLQQSRVASL